MIGHLLVFIALIVPAFLPSRPVPPVQMVTVRAVTPQSISRLLEKTRETAPPKPEPKVPQVVTPKEKLIPDPSKTTRKVQTVKRAEKQSDNKKPASEVKSPGKAEKTGLEGVVSTLQSVDNEYLATIVQIIQSNWRAPKSNDLSIKAKIFFEISPEGKLLKLRVETRSGNMMFDKSAYDALIKSNPLPALPDDFTSDKLSVYLTFSY